MSMCVTYSVLKSLKSIISSSSASKSSSWFLLSLSYILSSHLLFPTTSIPQHLVFFTSEPRTLMHSSNATREPRLYMGKSSYRCISKVVVLWSSLVAVWYRDVLAPILYFLTTRLFFLRSALGSRGRQDTGVTKPDVRTADHRLKV